MFQEAEKRLTFTSKAEVKRNVVSSKQEGDMLWIPLGDNDREQEVTVSTGPKGATLLHLSRDRFARFEKKKGYDRDSMRSSCRSIGSVEPLGPPSSVER